MLETLSRLGRLPKVHYSWPINPVDIVYDELKEFARIAGAVTVRGEVDNYQEIERAVRACKAAGHGADIAINYQVWEKVWPREMAPDVKSPHHQGELVRLRKYLEIIRRHVERANKEHDATVEIGAVLFETEVFRPNGEYDHDAAIVHKYRDTMRVLWEEWKSWFEDYGWFRPFVVWFGKGITEASHGDGWASAPRHFLPWDHIDGWSATLYNVWEPAQTRETFRRTVEMAKFWGNGYVTPWVALGAGYVRQNNTTGRRVWTYDVDYNVVYSWQLGRELNISWFGDRPTRYAPWHSAGAVCFYPAPFRARSKIWLEHFVAYVQGATGRMDMALT